MQAAVYHGQHDIRLEAVPDPICDATDIIIEVAACGVCGTDISAYEHGSAFTTVGQVMGHEFSGRIVERGSDVVGLSVGDRVTAWPIVHCDRCARCAEGEWHLCENAWGNSVSNGLPGGFADYVRIPRARINRTVYQLPDSVSWEAAAMVEPLSVGLSAVRFSAARPTDTVVVMGLGTIGLGVVQALRVAGVEQIIGVDTVATRRDTALKLGAQHLIDGTDVAERIRDLVGHAGQGWARVDAIVECTGAEAVLETSIELIRPAGRLVLVGLGSGRPTLDVNSLVAKQVGVYGTFAYRTEYAQTLGNLASGRINADKLVSHRYPLAEITAAFDAQRDRDRAMKVMVTGQAHG